MASQDTFSLEVTHYSEVYYSWTFNEPGNDITNLRGFDSRHNAFTLSNATIGINARFDHVYGRAVFQFGTTPDTFYGAEPDKLSTNADDWEYIQEALAGWDFGGNSHWALEAGVFLSPWGLESYAVKDNPLWSRSNLFFALPGYHTGVRIFWKPDSKNTLTFGVVNGWNNVSDNNDDKSFYLQYVHHCSSDLTFAFLYMGGNERAQGAPEGAPWRHGFDGWLTWTVIPKFSVMAQVDFGVENNSIGDSGWAAGSLVLGYHPTSRWTISLRGDYFNETVAEGQGVTAGTMFWPIPASDSDGWVSSFTLGFKCLIHPDHCAFYLEGRFDSASMDAYNKENQFGAPTLTDTQTTMTSGLTFWL